jgi:hypothetical protein
MSKYKKGDRVKVSYAASQPGGIITDTITVESIEADGSLRDSAGYFYPPSTVVGIAAHPSPPDK